MGKMFSIQLGTINEKKWFRINHLEAGVMTVKSVITISTHTSVCFSARIEKKQANKAKGCTWNSDTAEHEVCTLRTMSVN